MKGWGILKKGNMRKYGLKKTFQPNLLSVGIILLLPLASLMASPPKGGQSFSSNTKGGPPNYSAPGSSSSSFLLQQNQRNTLKDRLYYPPSFYNKRNNNNKNNKKQNIRTNNERLDNKQSRGSGGNGGGNGGGSGSFYLRDAPQDESIYKSRTQSFKGLSSPPSSSNLDNTLAKKLYEQKKDREFDNRLTTVISPLGRNGGSKWHPPRAASVNSILRLSPSGSLWGDEASSVCHTIPGLTKEQMQLCFKNPAATQIALEGLSLGTDECAHQMSKNRWNCSSLQGKLNPHSTILFRKGYRESAFGHAIAAAGVAYSIAKACSGGNLLSCGCGFQYDDQVNFIPSKDADYSFDESAESSYKRLGGGGKSLSSWKWSGCSHNMDYGIKFAKIFLDSREKSSDLPSRINLHNNKVGRLAVSSNMEVRCKCHGLSGSCELRTCWRSAPDFRRVGAVLKNKFRRAVMIDQSEIGNRPLNRVEKFGKERRQRRDRNRDRMKRNSGGGNIDLWYYERSPTYCESNSDFSIPGTTGRRCNATGGRDGVGSCSTLCCGRGYNTIRQVYTSRCQCQFIWCCEVSCKNCTVDEWITVCK